MVRVEMQRRKDEKVTAVGSSRFTSKYPFSGLLVCGECGHKLRRHVRTVGTGMKVPAWGCSNRISNGRAACDSHHVNEDTLQHTYTAAIRDMIEDAEGIMAAVKESAGLSWSRKTERRWIVSSRRSSICRTRCWNCIRPSSSAALPQRTTQRRSKSTARRCRSWKRSRQNCRPQKTDTVRSRCGWIASQNTSKAVTS